MCKLGMADYQLSDARYASYLNEQKSIIQAKPLLKNCYAQWYKTIRENLNTLKDIEGEVIELGSGGGFIKDYIPEVITSDVIEGVADRVIQAPTLPLQDCSVKALILIQVFHHIPNISLFLKECQRVLVPQGRLFILDPLHTPLARFLLKNFHTEPYDDQNEKWDFISNNKAIDANQANTWNIFFRDREQFTLKYPLLKVKQKKYFSWFSYIIIGGVSGKNRIPKFATKLVLGLDVLLTPLNKICSLMWYLSIQKN